MNLHTTSGGAEPLFRGPPRRELAENSAYPTPYANSYLLPLLLVSLAVQKHSPKTKRAFQPEYDYVIVGAGSAGSVVASRLSEEPCVTVLLLEAGKPPPRLTEVPAISRHFVNTDIDWQYWTAPQRWTAAGHTGRRIPWPSGKAVGGSSIWNAMLYVRGNRRNYDEWAEMGAKGWSYKDVLPYFKKLEDNADPIYLENGFHAVGGPITASTPTYWPRKKQALVEAIVNEGYYFVDPNAAEQNGFYDYQSNIRRGQRCSTAKGYLVPAENRTNLDILSNAMVRKVLIEGKRARGVEFDYGGATHRVRARREVILSAGTTNTAQLLMLSGIGIISQLKKFNISVIADLPVGLNMQDHAATLINFEVDDRLPQFDQDIEDDGNIRRYINNRTGALTSSEGFLLMSYLSKIGNGMDNIPDFCLYFEDFSKVFAQSLGFNPQIVSKFLLPLANKSIIGCAVQQVRPRSKGTVTLQSADPYRQPRIDPNYYEDNRDLDDIVQGLKLCMKIMENPAMKRIGAKLVDILLPGCEELFGDMDLYLKCVVRTVVATPNHQVGTAKMGDPSDPTTVVDPQLRVKGIQGLRVVDASVMPTVPWSNTNIPTIMVAEKASDMIKDTIQCEYDYYYDK